MGRIKCHGGWTTLSNLLWRISYLTEPSLSLLSMLTNSNPCPGASSCDKHPDESNLWGWEGVYLAYYSQLCSTSVGKSRQELKASCPQPRRESSECTLAACLSVCAQPASFTLPLSPAQSTRWYCSPSGQVSLHQLVTKTTPYRLGHRPN